LTELQIFVGKLEQRLGITSEVKRAATPELASTGAAPTEPMTRTGLEDVLKGLAIELWSDSLGERFWLVADEADAARLGEPRGTIYTAAEARRVVQIGDPATVAEVHAWKREFDGVVSVIDDSSEPKKASI
jgi:hypothetical protein